MNNNPTSALASTENWSESNCKCKRKGEVGKPRQRGGNKTDVVRNRGSYPLLGRDGGKGYLSYGLEIHLLRFINAFVPFSQLFH